MLLEENSIDVQHEDAFIVEKFEVAPCKQKVRRLKTKIKTLNDVLEELKNFLNKNVFANLLCNGSLLDRLHKIILISLLFKQYLSIRLHSFVKMFSTEILIEVSDGQKLTKQILFMNQ